MSLMSVQGFTFSPPAGFRPEESTVAMRVGLPDGAHPTPSLVVHARPAPPSATLESVTSSIRAELAQIMAGLKQGSVGALRFDDGGEGAVLAYGLGSAKGELRQYVAIRLHAGRVCTAMVTVPAANMSEALAVATMKALTSIRPEVLP